MNMIDGQDGLAGGVALGQVILLGYLSWHTQHPTDFYILFILGLLLIVFLLFNMRLPWQNHAVIFLGDAGSTFIAFVIAWVSISLGQGGGIVKPVVILWILAFPVFDLFQVCISRFLQGKPVLAPSLDHLHYLLHSAGMDIAISTWLLICISFSLGVFGVILNHFQVSEGWQLIIWLFALGVYLWVVKLLRGAWAKHYAPSI
jgi:UDP-GlcNAc:undecaprenyl-phosphate/decaprenyl-phosphate GlcNAc-1-phosphate transferase